MPEEKKTAQERVMDDREQLFTTIVSRLEEGKLPPWRSGMRIAGDCYNPVSGTQYKGINRLRLNVEAGARGYTDPRWMTFEQAKKEGYMIKRGSKGVPVEYWKQTYKLDGRFLTDKEVQDLRLQGRGDELEKGFNRAMRTVVFNGSQIEGIPPIVVEPMPEHEKVRDIEHIMLNSEATIYFDSMGSNFYSPAADEIHIAPRNMWENKDHLYSTTLHEIAHSTGHETRLGRTMSTAMRSKEYAVEELRAELASIMLSEKYNLTFSQEALDNSISYVAGWKQGLQEDKKILWQSYKDAETIVSYIERNMLQKELTPEKQQALEDILSNGITPEVATQALEEALPPSVAIEADPYDGEDIPIAPEYEPVPPPEVEFADEQVDTLGTANTLFKDLSVTVEFAELPHTSEGNLLVGPEHHVYTPNVTYTGEEAYALLRDLARTDAYRHAQDRGGYDKTYLTIQYKDKQLHHGRLDLGDGLIGRMRAGEAYTLENLKFAAVTQTEVEGIYALADEEARYIAEGNPTIMPIMTSREQAELRNSIVVVSQDNETVLQAKRADLISLNVSRAADMTATDGDRDVGVYRLSSSYKAEAIDSLKKSYKTFEGTLHSARQKSISMEPSVKSESSVGIGGGQADIHDAVPAFGYASKPIEYMQKHEEIIRKCWPKRNDSNPSLRRLHRAAIHNSVKEIRSIQVDKKHLIINPISGTQFTNKNAVRLYATMERRSFDDPRWATKAQAQKVGISLKEGEIGTQVYRYVAGKAVAYTVYNAAQFENFPPRDTDIKIKQHLTHAATESVQKAEQKRTEKTLEPMQQSGTIRGSFTATRKDSSPSGNETPNDGTVFTNPLSGAKFSGKNAEALAAAMARHGYTNPQFVTEKQAAQAGYEIADKSRSITLTRVSNGRAWKYKVYNVADVKRFPAQTVQADELPKRQMQAPVQAKEDYRYEVPREQGIPLSDVKQMYHKALPDTAGNSLFQYTEIHIDAKNKLYAMPSMHAEAHSVVKDTTYLGTYGNKADVPFEAFNQAVQTAYKDNKEGRSLEEINSHVREAIGRSETEFTLVEPKTFTVDTPEKLKSYMRIEMKDLKLQEVVNGLVAKQKVTVEQAYKQLRTHNDPKVAAECLRIQARKNAREAAKGVRR